MGYSDVQSRSKWPSTPVSGSFASVLLLIFVSSVAVPASALASGWELLPILDVVACSVPRAMVRTSTGEFYSACLTGAAGDLMNVKGSTVQTIVPSDSCGPFSLTLDQGRNAVHMGCLLNQSGVRTLWPNGTVTSMLTSDDPIANRSCTRTLFVSVSSFTGTLYVSCDSGDKILAVVLRPDGTILTSNQISSTSSCKTPWSMVSVGAAQGSNTSDVLFAACESVGLVLFNGTAPRLVVINTTRCALAKSVIQGPPGFVFVSCAYGLLGGGVHKVAIATLQVTTVLEWNDSTCTQPAWLSYSAASDTLYVTCYEGVAYVRGSQPSALIVPALEMSCSANARRVMVSRIGDTDTVYIGCPGFGLQAAIPASITSAPSICRDTSSAATLPNNKMFAVCAVGVILRSLSDLSIPDKLLLAASPSCRPTSVVSRPDGSRLYVGCSKGDGNGAVELRLNSSDDVVNVYNLITYNVCDGVVDLKMSSNSSIIYAACTLPRVVLAMPLSGPNAFTNRTIFSTCNPSNLLLAPAGDVLYVTCEEANKSAISMVTTGASPVVTALVNFTSCIAALQLALSRDGSTLYCACAASDLIAVDLPSRMLRVVGDATNPCHRARAVVTSPVSGELFVQCGASELLASVINNVIAPITSTGISWDGLITVSPVTGFVYTLNEFVITRVVQSCGNIAGWYLGLGRCNQCSAGSFRSVNDTLSGASLGSSRCGVCGPGTASSLIGASECQQCAAGRYSAGGTALSPALLCFPCSPGSRSELPASVNCTQCEPGKKAVAPMSTKCDACDVGSYAAGYGNVQCVPCAQGYFANITAQGGCTPCPSGFIANSSGSANCSACPNGSRADTSAAISCVLCIPGYFSNATGMGCTMCPVGKYSGDSGSTFCTPCEQGSYSDRNATVRCVPCSVGFFTNSTGQTRCAPCGPGLFSNTTGALSCLTCPNGTYSDGANNAQCTACPRGSAQPLVGQPQCTACSLGRFANESGMLACEPCQLGKYAEFNGSVECFPCSQGYFSNDTGLSKCTPCAIGSVSNVTGAVNCSSCQAGYSSLVSASAACSPCAVGFVSATVGSPCTPCDEGSANNRQGETSCTPCIKGTAVSFKGAERCSPCGPGSFSNTTGLTECVKCASGTFTNTTSATEPLVCPNGTYATGTGNVQCSPCAPGFYAASAGLGVCVECLPGTIANASGAVECSPCTPGYYADLRASARCIPCGKGSAQPLPGQSGCVVCAEGFEAPKEGSSTCKRCAVGTVTNNITGFSQCQPCPDGTYNAFSETSQVCQLCPENCRCSPLLGGAGIVSNADYYVSFSPQGLAVVTKCAVGYCGDQSMCGPDRVQGSPLCNQCIPGLIDWDGSCVRCDSANGGLIVLFLLVCFLFVGALHVLSSRTSRSGHLKVFMYFVQIGPLLIASRGTPVLVIFDLLSLQVLNTQTNCLLPASPLTQLLLGLLNQPIAYVMLAVLIVLKSALACWRTSRGIPQQDDQAMTEVPLSPSSPSSLSKADSAASAYVAPLIRSTSSAHSDVGLSSTGSEVDLLSASVTSCQRRLVSYIPTCIAIYLFTVTPMALACFSFLHCVSVYVDGELHWYVQRYPGIDCASTEYQQYLPLVYLVVVVEFILLPLCMLGMFVWLHLKHPAVFSSSSHLFYRVCGILFAPFQRSAFFWEFWTVGRRIAMVAIAILLSTDDRKRLVGSTLLCVVVLCAHLLVQPFQGRAENLIESVSLSLLCLLGFILLSLHYPLGEAQRTGLGLYLLLPALCMACWILFVHRQAVAKGMMLVQTVISRSATRWASSKDSTKSVRRSVTTSALPSATASARAANAKQGGVAEAGLLLDAAPRRAATSTSDFKRSRGSVFAQLSHQHQVETSADRGPDLSAPEVDLDGFFINPLSSNAKPAVLAPGGSQESRAVSGSGIHAPGSVASSEWRRFENEEGVPYFYNESTGESRWQMPS